MKLLDIFKSTPPKIPSQVKKPKMRELGVISSSLYRGKDFSYYNPDEILINRGFKIYDEMMCDEQVKAVLRFKQNAITSRKFYFDIGDDEETGQTEKDLEQMADFFYAVIENIAGSWRDKLIDILSALKNGFSVIEKVYEPFTWEGRTYWGLRDLKKRPASTFDGGFVIDEHGNLIEVKQLDIGTQDIILPIDKIIHFVHQPDTDRFYGESDLKAAHRAWWSKDLAIKFQNIHLERHAHGFIYSKILEGGISDPQRRNLEDTLANITLQTAMIVPENVELETIKPLSTMAYDKAIAQHDKSIAKSVLVPNLLGLSEQGQTGSYSQSQTQLQAFFWVLDDIDQRLSETLNEQLFKQLALWNFGSDQYPHYKTEPISDEQKIEIAKGWAELVAKGAVTRSESDERHIRRQLGMPEKEEAEEKQPPNGAGFPPGEEPVEIPSLDDWINGRPDAELVRIDFADKPWLRRVNFAKIERRWINQDKRMADDLVNIMAMVSESIEKQVINIGGDSSWGNIQPAAINKLKIPNTYLTELRKLLRINLREVFDESYEQARRELPKRKYKRIAPGMDKTKAERLIQQKTMQIANVVENEVLERVKRTLQNSIRYDKTLKETVRQLDDDLGDLLPQTDAAGRAINRPARLENIARTNVADATNQARLALFSDPELKGFVQAYEYSAIIDSRTTEVCEWLHGKIYRDFSHYAPPNHFQCRSLLVAVTVVDEWNGKESRTPPDNIKPQKGFK
jgi:SPP1 gp7 family putative phage head morphogenesis protein